MSTEIAPRNIPVSPPIENKIRKDKYQDDNVLKLQPEVLKILNNAK